MGPAPPEKRGHEVRRQLESSKNGLYVSPVSIWEVHHLVERKRLRLKQSLPEWLDQVFAYVTVREAPFNFALAAEASRIRLPQSDLGDVFLAATAVTFGLTLVTADSQLIRCTWLKTLAND